MNHEISVVEEHGSATGLADLIGEFNTLMRARAAQLGVPAFELTIVLTNDLAASVVERGESDFTVERLGGSVAGKTIPAVADYSHVTIFVDTALVGDDVDEIVLIWLLHVLAHEYGHALIGRLRAATVCKVGLVDFPTPVEAGAWLVQRIADEYRCDLFANGLFSGITYGVGDSDERHPLHLGVLFGDEHAEEFGRCLDELVHPGWADLVMDYRWGRLGLPQMYRMLIDQTWSMLVLTAHADAVEESAGRGPLMARFKDHPGVDLYMHDVWMPLRAVLDAHDPIPHIEQFAEVDREVAACADGVVDLWAKLGVTGQRTDADDLYLDVTNPLV